MLTLHKKIINQSRNSQNINSFYIFRPSIMKSIAKTPLNQDDISHLIDMALENKMPWNALANLLKDVITYDPKQVIDTLLKALEKLHLKILKYNHDVLRDDKEEAFIEKTSTEFIGENKIARDHVEVH